MPAPARSASRSGTARCRARSACRRFRRSNGSACPAQPTTDGRSAADEIRAHVQVSGARSAAEPFHRAADGEVDAEIGQVHRNGAGAPGTRRGRSTRPTRCAFSIDRTHVLKARAPEQDQRDRHQRRAIVDGVDQAIDRRADRRIGFHVDDIRAIPAEPLEQVVIRRKIEILQHDAVARAVVAEAGRDDRLRDGRVLVHRDGVGRRTQQRREQVAGLAAHLPPAFMPRLHASPVPLVGKRRQILARASRHRAERMTDEIRAGLDDREFGAPLEERIHRVRKSNSSSQAQGERPKAQARHLSGFAWALGLP